MDDELLGVEWITIILVLAALLGFVVLVVGYVS